jgi:hypothetical protein
VGDTLRAFAMLGAICPRSCARAENGATGRRSDSPMRASPGLQLKIVVPWIIQSAGFPWRRENYKELPAIVQGPGWGATGCDQI